MLLTVVVCRCRIPIVRSAITAHRRPGQRRVHMAKSGQRDRAAILSTVANLDARLLHAMATGKEVVARSACWQALVPRLVARRVRELWIERQAGAEHRDRADIRNALTAIDAVHALRYGHLDAADEAALWVADAAAWAISRGGPWAARLRKLAGDEW